MGNSQFLGLDVGGAPSRGIADWLCAQVRDAIAQGLLMREVAMPPSRQLAADLGVSRGVVVEAYRRLTDEGLIEGRAGRGTVVVAEPQSAPRPALHTVDAFRLPLHGSARDVPFDLHPGVPDLSAFPRAAWLAAQGAVLNRTTSHELGYGDPRGNFAARVQLARWLGAVRGVRASAEDIIVVSGVAQSLSLISTVLLRRGISQIAIEDPGSRGARDSVEYGGISTIPVAVDEHGLDVDALRRAKVQVVMVTPAHQFPTGVVLAPQRRRALLDWAVQDQVVIEDDYDAEHRYDRPPVPALQGSAPQKVIYTGSTSKSMAPGLRLGWLIAPARWQDELVAAKHAADLGSPALPQLVFTELLSNGKYERHLRLIRARQRSRRDAFLGELQRHRPEIQVSGVAAGLHLVIELPAAAGTDTAVAQKLLQLGVLVHPLSWHRQRPGPPGLVIGYAALSADRLREAARLIAGVISSG